ncbi:MAG: chromosomal replication initiator protein DnaA [Bacteroidota bacterium]
MSKTASSVWNKCLQFIEDNISTQAYKTWFEPISAVKLTDNALSIQVPSKFFYEWLEEHYVDLLKVALTKELGKGAKLVYVIRMENKSGSAQAFTEKIPSTQRGKMSSQDVDIPMKNKSSQLKNPFVIPGIRNLKIDSQLNPNYNFDNFLEGESNRLARSAGKAIANKPGGTSFNPLLIFGGSGLGKTHLAHAIGVDIKEKYPEKTVLYISAEKFTQQYIDSVVKKKSRTDFIHFYQAIDVLIVDDIQLLSGKKGTQEVFFHIFNHLQGNNKQVILTSDKAPVDMQEIEQRLLSRFKWGLTAELQSPDYKTRIAIIKHKLYRDGVEMPEQIIEYLASNIKNNIRELEGAIISLIAHSSFSKKEVDLDLAEKIVANFVRKTKKEISVEEIQRIVSEYFDMDVDTLQSKTRKRYIVQARQIAMYFAKKMTKSSLSSIGKQIGSRDHATVLHACKTVDNLRSTDKQFKHYVEELDHKLKL